MPVEVIDSVVVDVMWVKMCSTQDEEARLLIAVCYSTFLQKLHVVVEMKRKRCSTYQSRVGVRRKKIRKIFPQTTSSGSHEWCRGDFSTKGN